MTANLTHDDGGMSTASARQDARRWEGVHTAKAEGDVSWFQPVPTQSLRAIHDLDIDQDAAVIDVGGGTARLVDALLDAGPADLTVLDISATALSRARHRLGDRADAVSWLCEDLLRWTPTRTYDVWHDRAVFHFLTDPADQATYRDALRRGTHLGSHVVIATFAEDGPDHCTGLPVARYGPAQLARAFPDLTVVANDREEHHTPWGAVQPFTWVTFVRQTA